MREVLASTAARWCACLALVGATGTASPAPALAATGHRPAAVGGAEGSRPGAAVAPALGSSQSTEIGTAVAYIREPDGTVRRIR